MIRIRALHVALLGTSLMVLVACADQVKSKGGKRPVTLINQPVALDLPQSPMIERQQEYHTCGLVAVNMLYKSYGLDPDLLEVRRRIGVDQPALFWNDESVGVLPQDMLRVLKDDGFHYEMVNLQSPDAKTRPLEHFAEGHHAIMMYRFQGTAIYHWIVLDGNAEGDLTVYDPWKGLKKSTWEKEYKKRALSLILVRRQTEEDQAWVQRSNPDWDGSIEIMDVLGREMTMGE